MSIKREKIICIVIAFIVKKKKNSYFQNSVATDIIVIFI